MDWLAILEGWCVHIGYLGRCTEKWVDDEGRTKRKKFQSSDH